MIIAAAEITAEVTIEVEPELAAVARVRQRTTFAGSRRSYSRLTTE